MLIHHLVIPLPNVNLIIGDVGKAIDDMSTERGFDGIWEAAAIPWPILGPAGVVADQFVCRA